MTRRETGQAGEELARTFLKKQGYRILETNYRCLYGEIDIVARRKNCLVFAEVRTRTSRAFGTPAESISESKLEHMEQTAEYYVQEHSAEGLEWRIDLIAIELASDGRPPGIEQIENVAAR
jgi:putative endonuclease